MCVYNAIFCAQSLQVGVCVCLFICVCMCVYFSYKHVSVSVSAGALLKARSYLLLSAHKASLSAMLIEIPFCVLVFSDGGFSLTLIS